MAHATSKIRERLEHLDNRYRAKYGMSMIENLQNMRKFGLRQFIRDEQSKWTYPECGGDNLCPYAALPFL